MADGRLGALDLAAATATLLFTGAVDKITTCNITLCNRDNANAPEGRMALVDGLLGDLAAEDYFEYGAELQYGMPVVRTGVVVAAGQSIIVYSSLANVSAIAWGFVENV